MAPTGQLAATVRQLSLSARLVAHLCTSSVRRGSPERLHGGGTMPSFYTNMHNVF